MNLTTTMPDLPWGSLILACVMAWSILSGLDQMRLDFYLLDLHLLPVSALILTISLGILVPLWDVVPGFLTWSWVRLLTGHPGSLYTEPLSIPVIGWFLLIGFALRLPDFALYEERVVRKGRETWAGAIGMNLIWGLIHFLVGIPLIACLSIGLIAGTGYTLVYWNRGLEAAARAHFQSNLIVTGLLALYMLKVIG